MQIASRHSCRYVGNGINRQTQCGVVSGTGVWRDVPCVFANAIFILAQQIVLLVDKLVAT